MKDTIIRVENLSKLYRLGLVGTGTLSHDLSRWWAKLRRQEDPFAKLGSVNDRTKKSDSPFVWALKDINFSVNRGDVLGIIGKNGAGKSTLLKILSRVTSPTHGSIKSKGRIASLLEVGTGFHPELTGKENIFLNGAILGMSKIEIKSKLDEIIEFSGCANYIDTPVKRYSSGMTVRLAFAVAAHLEAEILVLDEVLAVGDAEFQKKCLGKMGDIANKEGRTVLFVSHNMAAIKTLCNRGLFIENGMVGFEGKIEDVIEKYISSNSFESRNSIESNGFTLDNFNIKNKLGISGTIYSGGSCEISGNIKGKIDNTIPFLIISITNSIGERIVLLSSRLNGVNIKKFNNQLSFKIDVGLLMLMPGTYFINLSILNNAGQAIAIWEKFTSFEIDSDPDALALSLPSESDRGILYTKSSWHIIAD